MSNTCILCNKGTRVVGKYSTKVRATKFNPCGNRRKYPNLQWATIPNGPRIKICTRCIKSKLHLKLGQFLSNFTGVSKEASGNHSHDHNH